MRQTNTARNVLATDDDGTGQAIACLLIPFIVPWILVYILGNRNPNKNLMEWEFPLSNKFCFKWYYIGIFMILTLIKRFGYHRMKHFLHSKYEPLNNTAYYEDTFDEEVVNKVNNLPSIILFEILSYSHSTNDKVKIITQQDKQHENKRRKQLREHIWFLYFIVNIFQLLLNIISLIILIYEFVVWYKKNKQYLSSTDNILWNGYGQFIITMLFHPSFRFYYVQMPFIYFECMLIILYLIASFIIIWCGFNFLIWLWIILMGCIICVIKCSVYPMAIKEFFINTWENNIYISQIGLFFIASFCYVFLNFCSFMGIALWISGKYVESFDYVLLSKYCDKEILIDFTDWKFIFLSVHWFLF
eukprot:126061_1